MSFFALKIIVSFILVLDYFLNMYIRTIEFQKYILIR